MAPDKRARLEQTWAHPYRARALPLIEEERFAKYFDPGNGRPNKSVRLVTSVLLLKEVFDLTDEEALAQLEWNVAWQYALDVTPEEAHTCQKTLHNYRGLLLRDDEGAALFESTTAKLIQAAGLRTGRQRLDSTHILSNIKLLTRLGLFVETLTRFLEALRAAHPRLCAELPADLRDRYLDREGYFSDARGSEAPRRLAQAALDVHMLVRQFAGHRSVAALETYEVLARLYAEQCVAAKEAAPERIELQEKPSSASLQSPSDPDVTYSGHKGKGYAVQLSETCSAENPFQVVTAVEVTPANESDQQQLEAVLEQTQRTCGSTPAELHADAGYGSGENILAARDQGTELKAPIGSKEATKHLPLSSFEFNEAGDRVLRCPAGKTPLRHEPTRDGQGVRACFTRAECRRCPLRRECPTKKSRKLKVLRFDAADVEVARRRIEQGTPGFKDRHRIRSGIEATNSELKRCHGLRKLRVRRMPRVSLAARLKVLALNIKRFVGHLTGLAQAAEVAQLQMAPLAT